MSDWPKRRRDFSDTPHPNSPAGRNFDYASAFGVPHPNSPSGRNFDYASALGVPHPNAPAARTQIHDLLGQAVQATHDWQNLAADRGDLSNESLEDRKEIVLRIFGWIKDKALAPLAVTDPVLFADLYVDRSLREFRESRHDRRRLNDLVIEDLEHVIDAADQLEKLKPSHTAVESLLSRIGGKLWGVGSDPDIVRGFIDLFKIRNLNERSRLLDERQQELTKRCALIRSEIQKCITLLRNQHSGGGSSGEPAKSTPPNASAYHRRTDWSALDQVVLRDWPAEDNKGIEVFDESSAPKIGQKAPHVPQECAYLKKPYTVESSKPNFDRIRKSTSLSKAKEIKYTFPGDESGRDALEYEVDVGGRKKKLIVPKDQPTNKALPTPDQLAAALGTVPGAQLDNIKQIVASPNPNPDDAYWAKQYNIPNFSSAATGGASGVTFYPQSKWSQEFTDSTMIHEGGHAYSASLWADEGKKTAWKEAMHKDGRSPSTYADSSADEDFSESLVMYSLSKGTQCEKAAQALYPNRYKALDSLFEAKSP